MTDAASCTPVSWLRLERYALGELPAPERADVDAHLASCARCRACADRIASDRNRELPPLPETAGVAVRPAAPAPVRPAVRRWPRKIRARAFAVAAAAAAFTLVLVLRSGVRTPAGGPRFVAVKGGDIAVEVVREREGSIAWEPTSFLPADRFKLLITCAPPLHVHADVVVLQSDGPAFPGASAFIACGNRVPVPPAFSITGRGAATICVGLDPTAPPARAALAAGDAAPVAHACVRLERGD